MRINVIGNVYAITGAGMDAINGAVTMTGRKRATKNAIQNKYATQKQSAAANQKKENGDETKMEYTTIEPGTNSNQILFILFKKR